MGKAARTDHKPGDILPASGVSYRVVRVLGSGGMADVYDVEDRNLGRRFVMKCMKSSIAEQKGLAERFEREARIIARLRHPNIVEVYRLDRLSGDLPLPYYLMERLDGDGLREALARKGKFELDVALGILIDVLNALDYTHEKEIVHRDLKPENVFLHRESNGLIVAKVLDFGVAKMKLAKMTGEGGFIGTYKYAAPEQHQNDAEHPVTHKADIFAVGLMGFEMLTGQHPFVEHGRGVQLVRAILETDAPPLPPGFPREVVAIFRAALSRDAARRPDAFEFLAVLKRAKDAVVPSHAERSVHEHSTVEEITRGQPGSEPPRPMTLADVASPTEPDKPLAYAKTAPLHVEAPAAAALLGGATVETQMRFDADGNMVSADPSSGSAPTPGSQMSPTNLPAPRSPRPPHFETSEQQQVQYLRDEPSAPPAASSEPESWRVIQQAASLLEEKPVPGPPNTSLRVSSQPVQKALTPSRASTPVPKRIRRKPLQQRVRTALARMPRHVAQRWTIAAVVTGAGLVALVATWAVHASRDAGNDRPRGVDHATVVTEGSKP